MDNKIWISRLHEGAQRLGIELPEGSAERLKLFSDELLRWNAKVNLTAITEPEQVMEKHILDSVAIQTEARDARSLLDLGAGAGFPGLPLALTQPALEVTLVDAVAKKVGFMKHAVAQLNLAPRVRAVHRTAKGEPGMEGIAPAALVVCRALMDVGPWLALAKPYVLAGGRALAMLAHVPGDLEALAAAQGFRLASQRSFTLPFSGAPRAVVTFAAA